MFTKITVKEWSNNNMCYKVRCPICGHRFYSHNGKHNHYMKHVREGKAKMQLHPVLPLTLPRGFFAINDVTQTAMPDAAAEAEAGASITLQDRVDELGRLLEENHAKLRRIDNSA